jgi:hypothetical protein
VLNIYLTPSSHDPGKTIVVINTQALCNEVSDPTDKVYSKQLNPSLMQVRNGVQDGLFTVRPLPFPSLEETRTETRVFNLGPHPRGELSNSAFVLATPSHNK